MKRLLKGSRGERLFYSIEPDMNDKHTHAHVILYTNKHLDREELAEAMNIEYQSISYLQPVENEEAVSNYCSKYVGKRNTFHDLLFKD